MCKENWFKGNHVIISHEFGEAILKFCTANLLNFDGRFYHYGIDQKLTYLCGGIDYKLIDDSPEMVKIGNKFFRMEGQKYQELNQLKYVYNDSEEILVCGMRAYKFEGQKIKKLYLKVWAETSNGMFFFVNNDGKNEMFYFEQGTYFYLGRLSRTINSELFIAETKEEQFLVQNYPQYKGLYYAQQFYEDVLSEGSQELQIRILRNDEENITRDVWLNLKRDENGIYCVCI